MCPMKKLFVIPILVFVLVSLIPSHGIPFNKFHEIEPQIETTGPSQEPTTSETDHIEPETYPEHDDTSSTQPDHNESEAYPNYYGRLCIPEANIDVALYNGIQQSITDRQDSANIFAMSAFDGLYICDHRSQEFGKLVNVRTGTKGYLHTAAGYTLKIECVGVLQGYNTGRAITDVNGNTNLDADYIMYTCENGIHNIRICLWKHS